MTQIPTQPGAPEPLTKRKTSTGSILLPWQQRWRQDQSDLKIWEKSRRIGATYTEANDVTMSRLSGKRKLNYWFSSADESAAYEFADYVRYWWEKAKAVERCVIDRDQVEDDDTKRAATAFVVRFPCGARMTAMTSNPRRFRSKGGDVCLDEFAYHDSPRLMYMAAEPCTTWGGWLRIMSTHNGEGNEFNRFVQMGQRHAKGQARPDDIPFSVHRITIVEAVEQGLVEKINQTQGTHFTREEFLKKRRAACISEDHWLQEYMAIPSIDTTAWLPYELLESCQSADAGAMSTATDGQRYIGMDVGETNDRTVITTLERVGDVIWVREQLIMTDEPLRAKQEALMLRLRDPRVVRACVDATGVGAQIAQEAALSGKGEAVKFSLPVKDELASPVRKYFEDRRIRIPDDADTRQDLHAIRMSKTSAGNPRFDAERTESGHADRFWALALALHAASRAENNVFRVSFF